VKHKICRSLFFTALLLFLSTLSGAADRAQFKRLVMLKVDGLNQDLLYRYMMEKDVQSGKSRLPWFSHVFLGDNGVVFRNFYVRGISLSAPSWSMLDTGQHAVIRGNAEFDRYTGQVYDYLNFFPFYIGYARNRAVDMPGVEVLDRCGIPLLIDRFDYPQILQSFQLFQRGVSWTTLKDSLLRSVSGKALFSMLESAAPLSLSSSLSEQLESQLIQGADGSQLLYLDFFSGDADHEGHATSEPLALEHVLHELDTLVGRVWTAIQQGPMSDQTLFVLVSDHGMNNVPGVLSQTFSLPDVFGSPQGGAHHVVTDREQLSDYKLKGINPLVHRVITPSEQSFYLRDQASHYPTAWLDLDGNERAAVHLRNNDFNKLHILLLQLARPELSAPLRRAAAEAILQTIDSHRAQWRQEADGFEAELAAVNQAISQRKQTLGEIPKGSKEDDRANGIDKANRRLRREMREWQNEVAEYHDYIAHLRALLALRLDSSKPFSGDIGALIPQMSLGDNNTLAEIQNYIVGPVTAGLSLDSKGHLDEEASFRRVNNLHLLSEVRVRNNPQSKLSSKPIDFLALPLPEAYLVYTDDENELLVFDDHAGRLRLEPVRQITQGADGKAHWSKQAWKEGLPLALFEDSELHIPDGADRASWLSAWHTESEWLAATHRCRYSNAVVGLAEDLSPVAPNIPGKAEESPALRQYERHRRELVQADFHVFASDHWNFNVRFPNPGGNHGGFLRISTHSVWMMAGAGLPREQVEQPFDSLNFASTVLNLLGRTPPMPDRVVNLNAVASTRP
jgi:hypothetical protein